MNRNQGPTDCCNHACQQGRTCSARMKLHTRDGSARIDTDYETELTTIDALIIGARFAACLMCAVSVVMVAFYWF